MIRLRRQLGVCSAAVAALFALALATPRSPLLYHRHAGGEHEHVHADGDEAWLDSFFSELRQRHHHHHDHEHGHAHHQHHGAPPAGGFAWETQGDHDPGHWHQQQRYQRAVVASAAPLIVSSPYSPAPETVPSLYPRSIVRPAHARGPPPAPRSA